MPKAKTHNLTARTCMTFRVGPYTYTLRITPGTLIYDGQEIGAGTIEVSREILISGDVPAEGRLQLLLRELARAWTFSIGEHAPTNADAWIDLCAVVAESAFTDLLAQGWPVSLERLQPAPVNA